MRPGHFCPGNYTPSRGIKCCRYRFNEAGAFLPRKQGSPPDEITHSKRFNEAGAFLPRKRRRWPAGSCIWKCFNEAGAFLPRKQYTLSSALNAPHQLQ